MIKYALIGRVARSAPSLPQPRRGGRSSTVGLNSRVADEAVRPADLPTAGP
jgi:hypothetical protein